MHCADVQTYTRMGHRELAREWRVETDWEMTEPKEPKPALGQNDIVSSNDSERVGCGGIEFLDEIWYRLVTLVIAESKAGMP